MKTYTILLLLSFCELGHTADIGNLKETKGNRAPVQMAAQPLVETGEILEFEVVHRLPSAFSPDIRRICIEFCGTDVLSLASVCKDWANSVIHYTNGAKKAHQHLASVGLKLPGGKFFDLYLNNDSILKSGGFTSSALRNFFSKRYREDANTLNKLGIKMPKEEFSHVPGNFAQRLVTATRTLGTLPAKVAEIELVNAVHNQFGALAGVELLGADFASFAGIKLEQYNLIKGLYDLLQNTQLPSALPGELTEPQTVCYELLKALKSYLVLKRESSLSRSDSYYPNQALIFNFLKGPDFPSNFMATEAEVGAQIKGALALTKALVEKTKAEAANMLITVRNALLA